MGLEPIPAEPKSAILPLDDSGGLPRTQTRHERSPMASKSAWPAKAGPEDIAKHNGQGKWEGIPNNPSSTAQSAFT